MWVGEWRKGRMKIVASTFWEAANSGIQPVHYHRKLGGTFNHKSWLQEVCRETWEMRLWMLKPEPLYNTKRECTRRKMVSPSLSETVPCLLLNTGDPVLAFLPTSIAPDSWVPMCTRHGSRHHRIHLGMKEALILPSERSQVWEVLKAVQCRLESARVLASSDSASQTQALH